MVSEARSFTRRFAALTALLAACSSSGGDEPGSAGTATGGSVGSGGMVAVTGGMAAATGGGPAIGGVPGTGGVGPSSGGNGTGGSAAPSGGVTTGTGGGGGSDGGGPAGAAGEPTATGGMAGAPDEGGEGGAAGEPPTETGTLTAFYLDVGGRVMAVDVATHDVRTVVQDAGAGPDGIALDLDAGYIYWTNMGNPSSNNGFLSRSDLDGSNMITLVPAGGTYTPKQLKIDHENGKLYWSDREGMRVMRANLDGSDVETLVTTGTTAMDRQDNSRWCVGIALDLDGGFVYWSQKGSDNGHIGSLRRAPLEVPDDPANRDDIEVLYDELPEPIDIDLDLGNGTIYWTDRGDDTVNRGPIEIPQGQTAANRTDREILIEGVREAIGVTLDLERGKLYFTGGTAGRVGMANLDGTDEVDLANGTAGLTGIVLAELP